MARRSRQFAPGSISHLTQHGVDEAPILRSGLDAIHLLADLREVTRRIGWQVLAWCFMPTHYHLLVALGRDDGVARAMRTLNSVYAREFNARHGRRGHLFRARYTDTPVETDEHLRFAVPYVLENPVRAGLVRRAEDWPWSGDATLEPRESLTDPDPLVLPPPAPSYRRGVPGRASGYRLSTGG